MLTCKVVLHRVTRAVFVLQGDVKVKSMLTHEEVTVPLDSLVAEVTSRLEKLGPLGLTTREHAAAPPSSA